MVVKWSYRRSLCWVQAEVCFLTCPWPFSSGHALFPFSFVRVQMLWQLSQHLIITYTHTSWPFHINVTSVDKSQARATRTSRPLENFTDGKWQVCEFVVKIKFISTHLPSTETFVWLQGLSVNVHVLCFPHSLQVLSLVTLTGRKQDCKN